VRKCESFSGRENRRSEDQSVANGARLAIWDESTPGHYWIHYLLSILRATLEALGRQPARDASRVAPHPRALDGGPDLAIDGTDCRRQRPVDATQQKEHYSGKKKPHTVKNLLLVNAHTGKVVYLRPTVAGKRHDKKMADEVAIAYPANATLDKDTGLQGYEPEGVLSRQPQTNRQGRNGVSLPGS
jgi:hypothetical protein